MTHPYVHSHRLGPLRRTCAKSWALLRRCPWRVSVVTSGCYTGKFSIVLWPAMPPSVKRPDVWAISVTQVNTRTCMCFTVWQLNMTHVNPVQMRSCTRAHHPPVKKAPRRLLLWFAYCLPIRKKQRTMTMTLLNIHVWFLLHISNLFNYIYMFIFFCSVLYNVINSNM